MVRKKKEIEPVGAEAPAEEAPSEEVTDELEEVPAPKTFAVFLIGRRGGRIHGQVNGKPFSVPTGVEVTLDEPTYDAVKAYISSERN